ncbi:MAG: 16S rRNA (uracil(1498)-N(3))-methyltransferase [Acidobacteria bacterium]|nr:16S rRNA (uracil(1498)-N(3))-methyltransferase [Acidobacteriota bacterium]
MRRFYAPPESFSADGSRVALSREESRHLAGVLRLAANDEVRVFDGEGREFLCVVADAAARGAAGATLEVRGRVAPACPESPLELTLACALLKGEKFDTVVQKATELGVARVVPVGTARADVKLSRGGDGARRVERWRRIAVGAAKQSGRARVPTVERPTSLEELLSRDPSSGAEGSTSGTGAAARRLILAERGGRGLAETVAAWGAKPTRVVALVGAEGGWEDEEIARARGAGWQAVTLGGRILRAETAGIVAAALVQHLCGDLV